MLSSLVVYCKHLINHADITQALQRVNTSIIGMLCVTVCGTVHATLICLHHY